jgi:hypothetical protein
MPACPRAAGRRTIEWCRCCLFNRKPEACAHSPTAPETAETQNAVACGFGLNNAEACAHSPTAPETAETQNAIACGFGLNNAEACAQTGDAVACGFG